MITTRIKPTHAQLQVLVSTISNRVNRRCRRRCRHRCCRCRHRCCCCHCHRRHCRHRRCCCRHRRCCCRRRRRKKVKDKVQKNKTDPTTEIFTTFSNLKSGVASSTFFKSWQSSKFWSFNVSLEPQKAVQNSLGMGQSCTNNEVIGTLPA